jgi:uncharacterized iron-regulated membrane protein
MTSTLHSSAEQANRPAQWWPDYRSVWRWHFYAGVIAIPFVILLSISGGIYLFRPQVEAWLDRQYDNLPDASPRQSPAAITAAAIAATPGSSLNAYELPSDESSAARVLLNSPAGQQRVYVHPRTLAVMGQVIEQERPMRWIFRLHGELLIGNPGSYIVEIAASWAIVLILTGLWLWWPRNQKGMAGVLYPRLLGGKRVFWRDLHGVTGFWISGLVLLLLISGLPWAKFWGDYLRTTRNALSIGAKTQDWVNGAAPREGGGEHAMHNMHGMKQDRPMIDLAALDHVSATVAPMNLAEPVQIKPPPAMHGPWKVMSMAANRPLREELSVDADGRVRTRSGFAEKFWPDKLVGVGVAWHEGQLFGWLNQLLGLIAALGLILVCVSAVVMWWRRRPQGVLGAPPASAVNRGGASLVVAAIVLLGILLPLFAATLVIVLCLEFAVLRRMAGTRTWLGLSAA